MPVPLSTSDFKLTRAICELRYNDAYLIYDRTGRIVHECGKFLTNLRVVNASPNQSSFVSEEGAVGVELGQCRFTSDKADWNLESFSAHCKQYFEVVLDCLEIKMLTRIGLRVLFRKPFSNPEESKTQIRQLNLLNRKAVKRVSDSHS